MTRRYVRTPTVFQMEATECGAASLSMILGYYGRFLPLERLRIETGVSRDGCNARNILRAAREFGLEAHGYRMELDDLAALQPPCIIHWEFNHFVVYEGMKGRYFYINDPAIGRRRLTREEMDKAFTGIVLTFSPTAEFVRSHEDRSLPSLILRRLQGQAGNIAALILLGLFLILPGLFVPIFSQIFVDQILLGGNEGWMMQLLIVMVLTALFHAGIYRYRAFVLGTARKKHVLLSAQRFVHHLLRLPMSFYDQRYSGDLANRIENNNSISMFLIGDLGGALLNICVAVFYLVLLVLYSPMLTLIGVVSTVLNLLLVRIVARTMEAPSIRLQQSQNKLVGALYAGLSITSTLKASGAENAYVARILGNDASVAEDEQILGRRQELLNAVPSITSEITSVLILMVGALMVVRGSLTPGMLTAYVSLFASFTDPVNALAGFTWQIQTLKANMLYTEDIMSYPEDERFRAEPDAGITGRLSGEVEVDDISYGYSPLEAPLVQDFHLHVRSGGSVALVGDSGCGKSTVARIISGLYQPWSGEIRIDGVPLNRIPREILATSVATVSQDIMLFSGSIRDNLTLWNKGIPEEDIMQAAKDACIHEVIIGKPGGYAHQLTEGGTNLSGGERQRLEIARALVTNPSVLVMDEATSALDPIIEKQILDNIQRRGCTCIVVAHRLSAIRDCGEIIVMQGGRIVQHGTHEALAAVEGPYRDLVQNN